MSAWMCMYCTTCVCLYSFGIRCGLCWDCQACQNTKWTLNHQGNKLVCDYIQVCISACIYLTVSTDGYHTCAISKKDDASTSMMKCWGLVDDGQIGWVDDTNVLLGAAFKSSLSKVGYLVIMSRASARTHTHNSLSLSLSLLHSPSLTHKHLHQHLTFLYF